MGRPIEKRYFGSDNVNDGLSYTNAGGESVTSIVLTGGANSYSAGTTLSIAASPIGGTTATASIAFVTAAAGAPGNGNVASYSLTNGGTGYTTAPAVTFSKPANVVVDGVTGFYALGASGTVVKFSSGVTSGIYAGMVANVFFATTTLGNPTRVVSIDTASGNVTLSTANTSAITSPISFGDVGRLGNVVAVIASPDVTANTIQGNAWTTSSTIGQQCDITKQQGARLYRVTTASDTNDTVKLVPTGTNGLNSPTIAAITTAKGPAAAGQMTIEASDQNGGTYWVTKLSGRTAVVVSGGTGTPGTVWNDYDKVKWTSTGVADVTTVKIATNN